MLERPREGEEERERGGMVRGSSCCFYRGRGGHWRGDRREEGAPSMVAGMGADGGVGEGKRRDGHFQGRGKESVTLQVDFLVHRGGAGG
jgi:hypothetical protein